MQRQFMAIDQYGQTFHNLVCPRRDLLEQLGTKHADKMYIERKDGQDKHIGYIIHGLWLTIYEVTPWYGKDL